ncbi:MAG: aldose 1-epimerase family protein [Pseudomonadota bacterium]|nr:aldose 1-epimerase family protein [Pseudomonadota bacterium]
MAITSAALTAQIDPLGAQLSSLKNREALDLLWDGDPKVWAGRAPLLFPIIGVLAGGAYRVGSKSFELPRHGFARGRMFSIENTSSTTARFRLNADAASLQVYPFYFQLEVSYEISGSMFSVTTDISNQGDEDMPASFGYHPAFRWPLPFGQPRSAHFIEFEKDEPAPARRIDAAGLLTAERHPTPIIGRRLYLTDSLFQSDVLIFDQIQSRSVSYGSAEGPRIKISFPDARGAPAQCLGIWSKPSAPFVCIEPWHGITDPQGFSGDFKDKPGIFMLAPGASLSARMDITLVEPFATP